ncbi:uncharacterized protein LOC109543438 [Dendroctonus ponderosae]|uniref:Transmembrane protein 126A n=1 Tax=Dendroctonus ponderosae TaxID=77166 RepID=J3JZH8_DENPD
MTALMKASVRDIPENAVILSETEALKFQMDIVKTWKKPSEVFAIRYGSYALGLSTLLSSVFLNNHFRRKFMLGHYGAFSTYIPVCILPAAVSLVLHTEMILRKTLLMNASDCPVCLQVKSAALQSSLGLIYPLMAAPIGGAALAVRYATYNIPLIQEKPKEVLETFNKMMRKIKTKTIYIFLWQALLGATVAYFETNEIIGIHEKLSAPNRD